MPAPDLITAIILNWNKRDLLRTCVESLLEQDYRGALHVVVVDNASTDGSADLIRSEFPSVRVIQNTSNVWYARGMNAGIRQTEGDAVLLLNNDTRLDPGCVTRLVEPLEDQNVGLVFPRLLSCETPARIASEGLVLRPSLRVTSHRDGDPDGVPSADVLRIFGGSGAAVLVRRATLQDIGLFDEDLVAYFEDVDLCWRARLRKWESVCVPAARVFHVRGASARTLRPQVKWLTERNRLWTLWKNCAPESLFVQLPALVGWEFRAGAGALLQQRSRPYLSPRIAAVRGLPAVLAKRKAVQARRLVDDSAIRQWINRPVAP